MLAKCHPDTVPGGNSHFGMAESDSRAVTNVNRPEIDWGAAYAQHRRWLQTVIRNRLGDESAVEDVLQEVGLAATKSSNKPDDSEMVAPWLYRVAIKQCLFYRRTRGRRRRFEDEFETEQQRRGLSDTQQPLDWLLDRERFIALRQALNELSELDREILLLKYTEGWTYKDLAKHLGVTPHAIEHRLIKSKQRLRRQLNAAGVES